jgi:para-aminobenzoate synthetase component I
MNNSADIRKKMNRLGSKGLPFVFLIDFLMENPQIFPFDDPSGTIKWKIQSPYKTDTSRQMPHLKRWNINPVSYETYRKGFDLVQKHILSGDTYLLN